MEKSILILDDQIDLLNIMERELRRRNDFQVYSASSITDALTLLLHSPIKLVISDIRLGEESGFSFANTLTQQYPDVGLILMSAYRSVSNREQAGSLGAFLFLEKPFTIAKLIDAVDEYFMRQAPPPPSLPDTDRVPPVITASGSLTHFRIQDLVQLFCLNGRAIIISVEEEAESKRGAIYIQRGQVLHAEWENLSGDEAFHAMMVLSDPKLAVSDWDRPVPQTISTLWEHLLLTSAVQNDRGNEQRSAQAG